MSIYAHEIQRKSEKRGDCCEHFQVGFGGFSLKADETRLFCQVLYTLLIMKELSISLRLPPVQRTIFCDLQDRAVRRPFVMFCVFVQNPESEWRYLHPHNASLYLWGTRMTIRGDLGHISDDESMRDHFHWPQGTSMGCRHPTSAHRMCVGPIEVNQLSSLSWLHTTKKTRAHLPQQSDRRQMTCEKRTYSEKPWGLDVPDFVSAKLETC